MRCCCECIPAKYRSEVQKIRCNYTNLPRSFDKFFEARHSLTSPAYDQESAFFLSRYFKTWRERLKSALYVRLKKRKTFFFGKKLEIFEKKIFGKCRTVPKNVKGGPFLIYKHAFCSKITKNSKGGPFGDIKKNSKKNLTAPKKNRKGGGGGTKL